MWATIPPKGEESAPAVPSTEQGSTQFHRCSTVLSLGTQLRGTLGQDSCCEASKGQGLCALLLPSKRLLRLFFSVCVWGCCVGLLVLLVCFVRTGKVIPHQGLAKGRPRRQRLLNKYVTDGWSWETRFILPISRKNPTITNDFYHRTPSPKLSGNPPRVVGSMSDSPCQAVTISGFFSRSAKFFHTLMAPSSWGAQKKRPQCNVTADATLIITCAQQKKKRSGTVLIQTPKLSVSLELNPFYYSCFSSLILHPWNLKHCSTGNCSGRAFLLPSNNTWH